MGKRKRKRHLNPEAQAALDEFTRAKDRLEIVKAEYDTFKSLPEEKRVEIKQCKQELAEARRLARESHVVFLEERGQKTTLVDKMMAQLENYKEEQERLEQIFDSAVKNNISFEEWKDLSRHIQRIRNARESLVLDMRKVIDARKALKNDPIYNNSTSDLEDRLVMLELELEDLLKERAVLRKKYEICKAKHDTAFNRYMEFKHQLG